MRESNFRPLTAAELLAHEPAPLVWIWEPYLPEGALAVVAAFMKTGKSTLMYALALAIAQGQPFLGRPTKRCPVLILAVEEHPRDVRARLERFGMTPDDPVHVHAGPLTLTALAAVRDYVKEHSIGMVMLDTLSCFWQIRDENDNAEVLSRILPFLTLARQTNATVVLIHHETKAGGKDGRGIRGGSALFGAVDQALMVSKPEGGGDPNNRVLRALGRYAESPAELVFTLDGDEYRSIGTPDELVFEAVMTAALAALDDVPRSPEDIAARIKRSVALTTRALKALAERETISRQGRGRKGDPYTFCRRPADSILADSKASGESESDSELDTA